MFLKYNRVHEYLFPYFRYNWYRQRPVLGRYRGNELLIAFKQFLHKVVGEEKREKYHI